MLVIKQPLLGALIKKTRKTFIEYADYLAIDLDFQNFLKKVIN